MSICRYFNSEYRKKNVEDSFDLGARFKMARQFNMINGNENVYKAKEVSEPGTVLQWFRKKLWTLNGMCTAQDGTRLYIYLQDPRSIVTANSEHKVQSWR